MKREREREREDTVDSPYVSDFTKTTTTTQDAAGIMKIIIQIKILKRTILTMTVLTATIFARRRRCAIVTKKTRCTIATITKASSVSTLREEERGTRGRGCGWKEQRNQTRREPTKKNLIKEQNTNLLQETVVLSPFGFGTIPGHSTGVEQSSPWKPMSH